MKQQWYGNDWNLQLRMFGTMAMLALVYLAFIAVMISAGVDGMLVMIVAIVLLGVQYFFSDSLVLASAGAREVGADEAPELHAIVDRLVQSADLPKPKVALIDSPVPNAFATGRSPSKAAVAVTRGLLTTLDRAELEAVIAHELSHVKNRDMMVMTIAAFFATVAQFATRWMAWGGMGRRRGRDGGSFALVFVVSIIVWAVSFLLIRLLSRYREFAADRGAALLTGSPAALQSALLKVEGSMQRVPERDLREMESLNAFFIIPAGVRRGAMELFSTHPPIEKRLAYLERLASEMERNR